jgi:quinol-cytochrome oxidoreductase complex cytochrome b subunit
LTRAARVALALAAFLFVVLGASGAWLWWNYRPDRDQWVRVVHQVAAVGLLVVAAGLLVLAILRRRQFSLPGVVAAVGVFVTVGAAYVIGRLLPWGSLALRAVTAGDDLAGVGAAFGSDVAVVAIDGRAVSSSTYEAWAYTHLALSALVVLALVMVWLRSHNPEAVRSS